MTRPVKILVLLILLLLLSTYSPTYKTDNPIFIFTIQDIKIENNNGTVNISSIIIIRLNKQLL